ncbi:MAG: DUF6362 family protein [Rhodospirillales bacterium]|jgi:hypothetical protein
MRTLSLKQPVGQARKLSDVEYADVVAKMASVKASASVSPLRPTPQVADLDEVRRIATVDDVRLRLDEARDVLRRLPQPREYLAMKGGRAAWPAYPLDPSEAFGYDEASVRPAVPSARDLGRLDETLGWLLWIEDQFVAACALAVGVKARKGLWPALCARDPRHRSQRRLQQLVDEALHSILRRIL